MPALFHLGGTSPSWRLPLRSQQTMATLPVWHATLLQLGPSRSIRHWGRVKFEAMARLVQEFFGHRQIARRFPKAYVAQIGRQVRKKTLDILSFSIPGHKSSDGKRMPGVMKTGW
jgi:hypothetical protein